MRCKMVAGNWKMHGSITQISALTQQLVDSTKSIINKSVECLVLPPTIYLPLIAQHLNDGIIKWGAQNVYPQDFGAITGEISGPMLRDYGCQYVLVGHSERRRLFNEDEKFVAQKFHYVKDCGMIPILCIGETIEEREAGLTKKVLTTQLLAVTGHNESNCFTNCIIAYEPVWAIGTQKAALPEQVQEVHAEIRMIVAKFNQDAALQLPIVYGGSVNVQNASALFAMPDVDGGLIGNASLNAQQFVDIIRCIN